jgi:hypothetical protein
LDSNSLASTAALLMPNDTTATHAHKIAASSDAAIIFLRRMRGGEAAAT